MLNHSGNIGLVTGANRGIGLEVVHQLAQLDMTVLLGSRDAEKGEQAAKPFVDEGLKVIAVQLDVADQESIDTLKQWTEERFNKLDIIVNNAAILYDSWQRVGTADLSVVRDAFETNTLGPWRMCEAFISLLRRSEHGRIVNVSSESGSLASMGGETPAYAISKVALNALTRMLAAELRNDRILVNSVCPGWVATDMGGPNAPRSVEQGAASVMWAATLPDDGPTGGFFRDGKPLPW